MSPQFSVRLMPSWSLLMVVVIVVAALVAFRQLQGRWFAGVALLGVVATGVIVVAAYFLAEARMQQIPPLAHPSTAVGPPHGDQVEYEVATEEDAIDTATARAIVASTPSDKPPQAEASDTLELSTPIASDPDEVTIPPRPKWVDAPPVLAGEKHELSVCSGPFERLRECRRALDGQLKKAVADYVDDFFQDDYENRLTPSQVLHYDANFIKSRLVTPQHMYHEVVKLSVGPMHQLHARLIFDADFRQELEGHRVDLERAWRARIAEHRLLLSAIVFGGVLGLLGVVFSCFKLAANRRSAAGRLQSVASAAILGLLVLPQ